MGGSSFGADAIIDGSDRRGFDGGDGDVGQ
jgi:hypothetical protein